MALREGTELRILDAAEELFFSRGVAATPIDAVIERAGVSAATLYRGWASKESLLAAALERRQRAWIAVWDAAVERAADDASRLLAVFDALDEFRAQPRGSRWCAFLGAAAEYVDAPAEVSAAVREDTRALRERLTAFAHPLVDTGERAGALAEQLLLVVTGDLAMRLREPGTGSAPARAVAEALVAAARR
jgi:AcrR family transcriptional regulator